MLHFGRKETLMASKKIRLTAVLLCLVLALSMLSACGSKDDAAEGETQEETQETQEETEEEEQGEEPSGTGVATSDDMTAVEDVVEEGMVPVTADQLVDGTYEINMKSSSSMFKVPVIKLVVQDGKMQALLMMTSEAYSHMYAGTAEEAAAASEADWIPLGDEENGFRTFVLPIDALDAPVSCAALSVKKQLWYDRTLLFRADSLPLEAFKEGVLTTPADLAMADGEYTVEVAFAGGTGKTTVTTPTKIVFADGTCTATIEFSSPNYDYMLVNGEKYLPVNEEGNSTFEIPVSVFDRPMAIAADTTAMSTPHEIDYTLTFDSASLKPAA